MNTSSKKGLLIVLVGPTAVGKTALSLELGKALDAEIFSSDSRQFYREMSIGTAKPIPSELSQVKHHFIDSHSVLEEFNASYYEGQIIPKLEVYFESHKTAILCGGSGLYIDAVCKGFDRELPSRDEKLRLELQNGFEKEGLAYLQNRLQFVDPDFYKTIDQNNSKRLLRAIEIAEISKKGNLEIRKGFKTERSFDVLFIGLERDRKNLYRRINERVDQMIETGLLEEAKSLLEHQDLNALKTVGYKEIFEYIKGNWDFDFTIEKIKTNSRRYAKRQLTWFKKNPEIQWFHPSQTLEVLTYIRNRRKDGQSS